LYIIHRLKFKKNSDISEAGSGKEVPVFKKILDVAQSQKEKEIVSFTPLSKLCIIESI